MQNLKTNVKCNHKNAIHIEVIKAFQQKIFNEQRYYSNFEVGDRISEYAKCSDCGKVVKITPNSKLPLWVKKMITTLDSNGWRSFGER
jgi:hypothetical protein